MQENSSSNSDVQYNPGRRTEFLLMGLLVILNIIIRIPSIPHEKGYDSFFIHSLANSVSNAGVAQWWINWMSVFGLYPYSYASAVPFTLSGMSQLTGIRMETSILLFCVTLGLFSIFASYSLATVLYDNFIHRFLFAAIFSLSAGTLNLTTWEITTRAQFLVFFPLLLYLLFRTLKFRVKFLLLFIPTVVFLLATHHYVFIALFFSGMIVVSTLIYNFNQKYLYDFAHTKKIPLKTINLNSLYFSIVFLILAIAFLFGAESGLITEGSRYAWMQDMVMITIRNIGFIFPLSIGGFIFLSLKKEKRSEEWAILICLLPTLVFSFNKTYGYITTYLFMTLLGSTGLINLIKNYESKLKIVLSLFVIILLLNVSFSAFFTHYRLGLGGGYASWYMKDEIYQTGEWIGDYLAEDKIAMSNGFESGRMFASYGGNPVMYTDDIRNYINGLITFNESNIVQNSPYSKNFYFDNPYTTKSEISSVINWIYQFPITDKRAIHFIETYNISYYYNDDAMPNTFFNSLQINKCKVYDVGRMNLWIN